jgi:hypothetical protein
MAPTATVRPRSAPTRRPRTPAAPAKRATTERAPAGRATATRTAGQEARRVQSVATTQARQVKGTAARQTAAVARSTENDVRELAGAVRGQADEVRAELVDQAREMLAETRDQIQGQADVQALRLARAVHQVGGQAVALSDGRPAQAGPLVDYAEAAATWLDRVACHIEERGVEGLATDVVDFARRRPGVFLAGAAVVGFGIGRLIRSGAMPSNGAGDLDAHEEDA